MEGGKLLKNFFGSIFINRDELLEAGINYPIKVEYYKITNEPEKENKLLYGIQVIKTEYKEKIGVEQNRIEHIPAHTAYLVLYGICICKLHQGRTRRLSCSRYSRLFLAGKGF